MSQPNLNEDLNIVSNSDLTITYMDGNLDIIQQLDDEPNDVGGLTAAELKAKFDEAGNIIKTYINGTLIPEILAADATEAARAAAEAQRETNEAQRIENENTRIAAEQSRASAETARDTAEQTREAAEQARADETPGIVAQATAQADAAEAAKKSAESAATSALSYKSAAYSSAVLAGQERGAAEQAKINAEAAQGKAEAAKDAAIASETAAKVSETAAKASETTAKSEADRAKSEADRAAGIKPKCVTVTLSSTGWDSTAKTQTVAVPGVLADETKQLITPVPAMASQSAYYEAGIKCTGQAANSLTFTVDAVPTADLTVYVVIQEVTQG